MFKKKIKFLFDVNETLLTASDDYINPEWTDGLKTIRKEATKDILDYLKSCI